MNKTRTMTIFANLLLEVESQGNLTPSDSGEILKIIGNNWEEN